VDIRKMSENTLTRMEELLTDSPGTCPVVFEVCRSDGSVAIVQARQRVAATPELSAAVRQICGDESIAVVGA
jgi:hypothetical protein